MTLSFISSISCFGNVFCTQLVQRGTLQKEKEKTLKADSFTLCRTSSQMNLPGPPPPIPVTAGIS